MILILILIHQQRYIFRFIRITNYLRYTTIRSTKISKTHLLGFFLLLSLSAPSSPLFSPLSFSSFYPFFSFLPLFLSLFFIPPRPPSACLFSSFFLSLSLIPCFLFLPCIVLVVIVIVVIVVVVIVVVVIVLVIIIVITIDGIFL